MEFVEDEVLMFFVAVVAAELGKSPYEVTYNDMNMHFFGHEYEGEDALVLA